MKKIEVNLPITLSFCDYHEVDCTLVYLKQIFGAELKGEELGFDYNARRYIGIFFLEKDEEYESIAKEWRDNDESET